MNTCFRRLSTLNSSALRYCSVRYLTMRHHLMVGTWTPPGAIYTIEFDDEALTLKLLKKTEIAHDEPISWMTFDVSRQFFVSFQVADLNIPSPFSMRERTYMERL